MLHCYFIDYASYGCCFGSYLLYECGKQVSEIVIVTLSQLSVLRLLGKLSLYNSSYLDRNEDLGSYLNLHISTTIAHEEHTQNDRNEHYVADLADLLHRLGGAHDRSVRNV